MSDVRPVRLQLSRKKGFDLQALSLATNGLPAVNVARPSKWGNPYRLLNEEGWPLIDGPNYYCDGEEITWHEAERQIVQLFREHCVDGLPNLSHLHGKNLACWCAPGLPCHADVLLELANRPLCRPAEAS